MKAPVATTTAFLNAILFLKNVVGPFREKIKSCYWKNLRIKDWILLLHGS